MRKIKLIFGLGNQGEEFIGTRHNLGKEIVQAYLTKPKQLRYSLWSKFGKLYLATNLTYVNESGRSVKELLTKFNLRPEEILLIHDDADILFPNFKCSFGAGTGGHKGIASIVRALKTKNFWRFRIGIQKRKRVPAMDLVLQKWTPKEKIIFAKMVKKFGTIFQLLEKRRPNELNLAKDYFYETKR